MKKGFIAILQIVFFLNSNTLLAAGSDPIQQIKIANILSNNTSGSGGITHTLVQLDFYNNDPTPCFTNTLPYNRTSTVYVGTGQACTSPIQSIIITPLPNSQGYGPYYNTPASPVKVNTTLYYNQLIISQNTAPVFDPSNGEIVSKGTIQTDVISKIKQW